MFVTICLLGTLSLLTHAAAESSADSLAELFEFHVSNGRARGNVYDGNIPVGALWNNDDVMELLGLGETDSAGDADLQRSEVDVPSILSLLYNKMQEPTSSVVPQKCRIPGMKGNVVRFFRCKARLLHQDPRSTILELKFAMNNAFHSYEDVTEANLKIPVPNWNSKREIWELLIRDGILSLPRFMYEIFLADDVSVRDLKKQISSLNANTELKMDRAAFIAKSFTSKFPSTNQESSIDVTKLVKKWRKGYLKKKTKRLASAFLIITTDSNFYDVTQCLPAFTSIPKLIVTSHDRRQCPLEWSSYLKQGDVNESEGKRRTKRSDPGAESLTGRPLSPHFPGMTDAQPIANLRAVPNRSDQPPPPNLIKLSHPQLKSNGSKRKWQPVSLRAGSTILPDGSLVSNLPGMTNAQPTSFDSQRNRISKPHREESVATLNHNTQSLLLNSKLNEAQAKPNRPKLAANVNSFRSGSGPTLNDSPQPSPLNPPGRQYHDRPTDSAYSRSVRLESVAMTDHTVPHDSLEANVAEPKPDHSRRASNSRSIRSTLCKRHSMQIHFHDIGWTDWLIAPRGIQAYQCAGDCPFPLVGQLSGTNHALLLNLMSTADSHGHASAKCVPTTFTSMPLLYFDKNGVVVLRLFEDMVVQSCGCR